VKKLPLSSAGQELKKFSGRNRLSFLDVEGSMKLKKVTFFLPPEKKCQTQLKPFPFPPLFPQLQNCSPVSGKPSTLPALKKEQRQRRFSFPAAPFTGLAEIRFCSLVPLSQPS